ncbi:MAG: serine hydrolase domain-containing protein [Spirochaetales bacterium]
MMDDARGAAIGGEASLRLRRKCGEAMEIPGKPLSGLAVILLRDGQTAWEGYFGSRRFPSADENDALPVDAETRWRVASLSKPVTALGAMRLEADGLLDLDQDISAYLGYPLRNPHFPGKAITTRMLLGHTSSLRDAGFYYPPLGHAIRDLLLPGGRYYDEAGHFATPDPSADRSPGAFYAYCNLGYAILGGIMERLTGMRFDLYMKKTIFDPLGIDGGFNPKLLSEEGFRNLSPIYRKCRPESEIWDGGGPWFAQIDDYGGIRPALPVRVPAGQGQAPDLEAYAIGENGALFSPQGGMRVRARDLAKIAQFFIEGGKVGEVRIVPESGVSAMMRPGWLRREDGANCEEEHSPVYATGLGLMRPTGPGGGPALWGHRGNAYGFLGGMFIDRPKSRGYVYMIGGTGADPERNRDPKSGLSIWEDALGGAIEEALSST